MKKFNSLKELRLHLELTQEQLSEMANIRRATITDIESGRVIGSIETYQKIAAACNCDFNYYFLKKLSKSIK